jgi:hypothetical protein
MTSCAASYSTATYFSLRNESIVAAASRRGFSALCTYVFDVMSTDEWPKRRLMVSIPTPFSYIKVPAV